ncbi:Zinc finger BED domain-containing protein DAYSLEEPER [Holothuria leucospilota]|uniref:Zinc finger BED domain-containing protein DAYSLEEPER n=1 Tax=Holothuria leucospilota TaxID=206669 RepID=A0A9Q0YMR9_HOLLE|nr:Zinc finger BED domain-containing protein DAYSLEEPER [Holothuria leucospilota]
MSNHLKLKHHTTPAAEKNSSTLDSFVAKTVCHPQKMEKLNYATCDMIAKDALPVSFVEGDGFCDLMKAIEPSYTVPSRKTVSTLLLAKFVAKKMNVKAAIEGMASVSLTTDCWTSRASEGYMTVTAHSIDEAWRNVSFVLDTTPVGGADREDVVVRHTAAALTQQMSAIVEEWALEEKLGAIVHDNASNVKNIGRSLGVDDVPCAGHTLQLCVNNGLKAHANIGRLISCGRRLVGHFKKVLWPLRHWN